MISYSIAVFVCLYTLHVMTGHSAESSSEDLYSESPCELRPLSSYKDNQGNLWGVGNGNLWWFNATNLSWSLLPLPNGTASDPWRVACADPKRYVAVLGRNSSLILHLPWQHWQTIDSDDVSNNHVDMNTTWCSKRTLYSVDSVRERLYVLEPDEARWTFLHEILFTENFTFPTSSGVANTWVGSDSQLFLLHKFDEYNNLVSANTTAVYWHVVAEKDGNAQWPNLDDEGLSIAWNHGSSNLWLWKEENGIPVLWYFNLTANEWRKGHHKFEKTLPRIRNVLASWQVSVNGDAKNCLLVRSSECTAQYSVSHTQCWQEDAMLPTAEKIKEQRTNKSPTTVSTSAYQMRRNHVTSKTHRSNCTMTHPETSSSKMTTPVNPTSSYVLENSYQMKTNKHSSTEKNSRKSESKDTSIAIVPSRISAWHQHTSVFGSIVFFGTSITIFGMVGVFWCFRRCVHFPKDALLLRDPPSVRYTAIPDSLAYDLGRPSAYTVIPDTIA